MHLFSRVALAFMFSGLAAHSIGLCAQDASEKPNQDKLHRADLAFHSGFSARQAGHLDEARKQFGLVVQLAPQIPEGHAALGEVEFELGLSKEAAAEFETALQLKPADPGLEANLALAYEKAREPAKAVVQFEAAFLASQQPGAQPVDANFCQAYARALAATDKTADAIRMFREAADRGAATPEVFDAIGSLYAQSINWSEAQSQFEKAVSIDSSYVPARIHLGIVQREQGDFQAALASLQAAVTADPSSAIAQSELGRTLEATGQDEAATPHLEQAIRLDPDLPGVQNELAMDLQRQGRQQEAIPWFEQAIEHEPRNRSALLNLGLALTLTGKAQEALVYFGRAKSAGAPDATFYKDQGVAHVQLSAFDAAITDFTAALALDPDDVQIHYDLGMAYKMKDRVDDAIAELTRAGEMDPKLQDPPYTLGILYMQTGKLDQAVVQLQKAVTLRPQNGDAWAILGSTLKQDSRLDEARAALEKAIPLLPGQPGPRVTLAGVLAEQASAASTAAEESSDPQKAEQLRGQAKDLRAQAAEYRRQGAELARGAVSRQKANFALNAGNQLLLKGQITEAAARYQESIAADPSYDEPHRQLALAYDREGRTADAASERAKADRLASPAAPHS